MDPLTPTVKEETEHVTAEQIFRELEDLAQDIADSAEPSLETSDHLVEPEPTEGDDNLNAAEVSESVEPKEEEADFEEVLVEEEPVELTAPELSAAATVPAPSADPLPSHFTIFSSGRGCRRRPDNRPRPDRAFAKCAFQT